MKHGVSLLLTTLWLLCTLAASAQPDPEPRTLKVLCIGSSFGVDSTRHLYHLAKACGATDIKVANLFRTATTIDNHWQLARDNEADYEYRKNTTGEWTSKHDQTMLYGIQDEPWDLIVIMQSAEKAADASTYTANIDNLIDYINTNKTNPNAKVAWNAVWSFTGTIASNYYKDQATMYYFIVNAVKENVLTNPRIEFVIPTGTGIQNARTSLIGNNFNRDSMHLNSLGSYVAGMVWIKKIKGWSIDGITSTTEMAFSADEIKVAKDAANAAVATPKRITLSKFPPTPAPPPPPSPVLPAPTADGKIMLQLLKDDFNSYTSVAEMEAAGWHFNPAGGAPTLSSQTAPQNLQSMGLPADSSAYRLFSPVAVNYLPGGTSPGKNAKLIISFDGHMGTSTGASQSFFKISDSSTLTTNPSNIYSPLSIGRRGNNSIRYSDSIASGSTDFVVSSSLNKFTKVKFVIKLTDENGEYYDVAYTNVDIYVGDMTTPITGGASRNMIDRYTKLADRFYMGGDMATSLDNLDIRLEADAFLTPIQAWRLQHFSTIYPNEAAADEADADGDGAINEEEFEAGSNPRDSTSRFRVSSTEPAGADFKFTFSSVAGKLYDVQHTDSLDPSTWETVLEDIEGTGGLVPVTIPGGASGPGGYFRVIVAE
jgi:hypothetical protein